MEFVLDKNLSVPQKYDFMIDTDAQKKLINRNVSFNPNAKLDIYPIPLLETDKMIHRSYLEYIKTCWADHHGLVISPHALWFTALRTFAKYVVANSESLRDLIVGFDGKKTVEQVMGGVNRSALDQLAGELTAKATDQSKISKLLDLPKFSTMDTEANINFIAVTGELLSPYFNYVGTKCGIPKVRIEGTREDYLLMAKYADKFREHFKSVADLEQFFSRIIDNAKTLAGFFPTTDNSGSMLSSFYNMISNQLKPVLSDVQFLREIFAIRQCGSGHPDEYYGWIMNFTSIDHPYTKSFALRKLIDKPTGKPLDKDLVNLAQMTVHYERVDSGTTFNLLAGFFVSGYANDGFLTCRMEHTWIVATKSV